MQNSELKRYSGIEVIVVEDNIRDMDYLTSSLSSFLLVTTDRGDEALELFKKNPDAYVVSDVQLPGLNGVELATEIWKITETARIVVWSQYNDEVYLRSLSQVIPPDALYGYVLKNNSSHVLEQAVTCVFNHGECWLDPQLRPITDQGRLTGSGISDGEYDVLVDIALGMTDQLIAQRRFLSRRGVQSRLNSLYVKLGVDQTLVSEGINSRSRAISIALNRGLINQHELSKAETEFVSWQKSVFYKKH